MLRLENDSKGRREVKRKKSAGKRQMAQRERGTELNGVKESSQFALSLLLSLTSKGRKRSEGLVQMEKDGKFGSCTCVRTKRHSATKFYVPKVEAVTTAVACTTCVLFSFFLCEERGALNARSCFICISQSTSLPIHFQLITAQCHS